MLVNAANIDDNTKWQLFESKVKICGSFFLFDHKIVVIILSKRDRKRTY